MLDVGIIVVLLERRKPRSAVILGSAATLLITEVLSSIRREKPWSVNGLVSYMRAPNQ